MRKKQKTEKYLHFYLAFFFFPFLRRFSRRFCGRIVQKPNCRKARTIPAEAGISPAVISALSRHSSPTVIPAKSLPPRKRGRESKMRTAGARFNIFAKNKTLSFRRKPESSVFFILPKRAKMSGFALRQKLKTLDSGFRRNDQEGGESKNLAVCPQLTFWIPAFAGMTVGGHSRFAGMRAGRFRLSPEWCAFVSHVIPAKAGIQSFLR